MNKARRKKNIRNKSAENRRKQLQANKESKAKEASNESEEGDRGSAR